MATFIQDSLNMHFLGCFHGIAPFQGFSDMTMVFDVNNFIEKSPSEDYFYICKEYGFQVLEINADRRFTQKFMLLLDYTLRIK